MKQRYLYLISAVLICTAGVLLWLYSDNIKLNIELTVIILALLAVIIVNTAISEHRNNTTLKNISELLSALSDLREISVFNELEDSLTGKLQLQASRLSEIIRDQRAESLKDKTEIKQLISDISHQLKTPVAAVKMYGDLLCESSLTDEQRIEYSVSFSAALDKLTFLTENLVKMSRLESGIIVTEKKDTDLNKTVLEAVLQVFSFAKQKGVEIVFDSDSVQLSAPHDGKWTAEAIFNILDNAVKYSKSGSVVNITANKYEMYECIEISDSGRGIDKADISKIFTRFFRGENAKDENGAGIGLYLTNKIITAQGGHVKVESSPHGTVFSIFLPK